MKKALIHCKLSYLDEVVELGFDYEIFEDEVYVYVPDMEFDSSTEDNGVLLCDYHDIDYKQVNRIEFQYC